MFPWDHFEFVQKFAETFECKGEAMVSTTLAKNEKDIETGVFHIFLELLLFSCLHSYNDFFIKCAL
jgi:hypothetical protein